MIGRVRQLAANGRWPADVDIWHVPMPEMPAGDLARQSAFVHLDADERARAARFRFEPDRVRFATTRSVLRELLGRYASVSPAALKFSTSGNGRPELALHAPISFNVSHSHAHALIVVSRERRVGIDVEYGNLALDWRELSPLVCTPPELRVLESMSSAAQRTMFLRCWTAKEAILKTLGLGIAEGLLAMSVNPAADAVQRPVVASDERFDDARSLAYRWIDDIPGYQACLAYDAQGASLPGAATGQPAGRATMTA